MEAARPTKLIGRFPHRNYDVAQHHPGDGLNNESHECVAKVLTGFWDMLADQGFIARGDAEKLKSCVKVFDQVRLVGVPISFVKCVTLTNYASQHPLAQITRKGRVEVNFDDEAERLCGGAKGVADLLALHHARLELMLKIWHLAHDKPLAVVAWGEYAREHVEILAAAGLVEYLGHVMHPASYWRLMMDVKKRLAEGKTVPCGLKKEKHFDGGAALCPEITRSLETEPKINLIGRN